MDPILALLIALYLSGKFTKNTVQDLAWKARGEDPPSFRREQERWQRKQDRKAGDIGPTKKLFRNAWADACASADERRARIAEKSAAKRRAKWAKKDLDAAEDEAREINERISQAEPTWPCDGCQAHLTQADVAGSTPAGNPLCKACQVKQAKVPCHFCRNDFDKPTMWAIAVDGSQVLACPWCWHQETDRRRPTTDPPPPESTAGSEEPQNTTPDQPTTDAEVIQFADWQRTSAATEPTKENPMSEVAGLRSAITFAQGSASSARQGAMQTEAAIAALTAGGTSGSALTTLQQAMEQQTNLAAAFETAASELTNHLQVAEAYEANRGAGTREFVTSD